MLAGNTTDKRTSCTQVGGISFLPITSLVSRPPVALKLVIPFLTIPLKVLADKNTTTTPGLLLLSGYVCVWPHDMPNQPHQTTSISRQLGKYICVAGGLVCAWTTAAQSLLLIHFASNMRGVLAYTWSNYCHKTMNTPYADGHASHSRMFEGSKVDSTVDFLEQSFPKASTLLVLMIRWQWHRYGTNKSKIETY